MATRNEQNKTLDQKILHQRAESLAKKAQKNTLSRLSNILVFVLGDEQKFAVPYKYVKIILSDVKLLNVPFSPKYMYGLYNHHSEILTVANSYTIFKCPQKLNGDKHNLLIIEHNSKRFALAIDDIVGEIAFDEKKISLSEANDKQLILGIYGSDIAVINLEKLLALISNIKIN